MFGFFFTKGPVTCFEDAKQSDTAKFGRFHRGMLERGVYLAPSAYEVSETPCWPPGLCCTAEKFDAYAKCQPTQAVPHASNASASVHVHHIHHVGVGVQSHRGMSCMRAGRVTIAGHAGCPRLQRGAVNGEPNRC